MKREDYGKTQPKKKIAIPAETSKENKKKQLKGMFLEYEKIFSSE